MVSAFFPDALMALAQIPGAKASDALSYILEKNPSPVFSNVITQKMVPSLSDKFKQRSYDNAQASVVLMLALRGEAKLIERFYKSGAGSSVAQNTAANYLGKNKFHILLMSFLELLGDVTAITSNVLFMLMMPASSAEMTVVAEDAAYVKLGDFIHRGSSVGTKLSMEIKRVLNWH